MPVRWFRPLALLLSLLLTHMPLHAGMYKWVDSQGNVHYTQNPPSGRPAERMAPPPPPRISAEEARKKREEDRESLTPVPPAEADIAAEKKRAEIARRNCDAARENLRVFSRHRRIKRPDGTVVVLDDKERGAKITEAKQQIERFCK